MKLSAVIIALNEERNIAGCLDRLKFADEIVIVDSGSSDKTCEIARRLGAKVLTRKFDDFSSQKNFAVSQCSGEWVFSVDADERVGAQLAKEIRSAIFLNAADAYSVLRCTQLFERRFRFSGLQSDRPIRLFRKECAIFKNPVHEELEVKGSIGALRETLEHISFQTLGDYWKKLQLYTDLIPDAADRTIGVGHLLGRPLYRFLSIYFWKQGFRDGIEGFIYATLSAYYEFVRWAKCWEKRMLIGE